MWRQSSRRSSAPSTNPLRPRADSDGCHGRLTRSKNDPRRNKVVRPDRHPGLGVVAGRAASNLRQQLAIAARECIRRRALYLFFEPRGPAGLLALPTHWNGERVMSHASSEWFRTSDCIDMTHSGQSRRVLILMNLNFRR